MYPCMSSSQVHNGKLVTRGNISFSQILYQMRLGKVACTGKHGEYWDTASKCATKPLSTRFGNFIMYRHFPSHFLLFYYSFITQMVCGAFHSTTNIFLISRAIMLCFIYSFSFVLLYTCSLTISRHKWNMLAYFCIYTWYFSQCSLSCLLHKQLRWALVVIFFIITFTYYFIT